ARRLHFGRGRARLVRPGPRAARRGGGGPRLPGGARQGGRDHLPVERGHLAGARARPPPGLPDHRLDAGQRRWLRARRELRPAAPGRAGGGVQPAARPAVRRGAAGYARARLQPARGRRAEHRAAGQAAARGPDGPADLADGTGSDQVLAARAGRPGRALERRRIARPAAGRAHPAPDGGPPVSGPATRPVGWLRAVAGTVSMRAVASAVAMRAAAVLLGAGSLVWAALPAVHRGWSGFVLVLAIAGVAAGGLRLALAAVPVPEDSYWPSPGLRVWRAFLEVVRQVPWEEGAVIGIVWLEV